MPIKNKRHKISKLRKAFTILLLPEIIFLWMTSLLVIKTGTQSEFQKVRPEKIKIESQEKDDLKMMSIQITH